MVECMVYRFLYSILDNFKEICEYKRDKSKAEEYKNYQNYKRNLEEMRMESGIKELTLTMESP